MPRRATAAVCAAIALVVCALANGQTTSPAFQPFFRMGASTDYRSSNRLSAFQSSDPGPTSNTLSPSVYGYQSGDGSADGDGELGGVDSYPAITEGHAVGFTLTSTDYIRGFEDYLGGSSPHGTATGPIMYVGNYGGIGADLSVIGLNTSDGGGDGTIELSASGLIIQATNFDAEQMKADPNESLLQATIITIQSQLAIIDTQLSAAGGGSGDGYEAYQASIEQLQLAQHSAIDLQVKLLTAIATDPSSMVMPSQFDAEVASLNNQLSLLDTALVNLGSSGYTPPAAEEVPVGDDTRTADDIDGNGSSGTYRVLADIDGDGVIESGEVIAVVNNFGDLHTFNVFFDSVYVEAERDFTSFELMKQHVLFGDAGLNTADTGWRFEAYRNEWAFAAGDEVRGTWGLLPERTEAIAWAPLQELAEQSRFSLYSTAGLRSLLLDERFYFDGRGSILGRTAVEQENGHYVVGPQLGLGAVAEASMFRFEAVALGLVGYGRVESRQHGVFGEEAVPGALNLPAAALATRSAYKSDDEQVAWHGETRLTASCQLTQQLRFDATWRWYVTGPVYDAAGSIAWNAPDFGYQPTDGDAAYGNDWFLGLTYGW